jgi:hypothetical protein
MGQLQVVRRVVATERQRYAVIERLFAAIPFDW